MRLRPQTRFSVLSAGNLDSSLLRNKKFRRSACLDQLVETPKGLSEEEEEEEAESEFPSATCAQTSNTFPPYHQQAAWALGY
jgi:hypothetical protein